MDKKRIIIWGTGWKAIRLLHYLDMDKIEILGFSDNSNMEGNENELLSGYDYFPPAIIDFDIVDYFVIASGAYCEITNQLIEFGVGRERIVQAFNVNFMIPDTLYYFNEIERELGKYEIFLDLNCFAYRIACGVV